MNSYSDRKKQKGFTLLEVLIALFILAVGLLAAASMQTTSIRGNTFAQNHTAATSVAQMVMDDLLSVPVTFNPAGVGVPNPVNLPAYPDWYSVFMTTVPAANPQGNNWAYIYNRFPPFNGTTDQAPYVFYTVPGAGTFRASFSTTPHDPFMGQNITRIVVVVVFCDDAGNMRQNSPVVTLTNFRQIPTG